MRGTEGNRWAIVNVFWKQLNKGGMLLSVLIWPRFCTFFHNSGSMFSLLSVSVISTLWKIMKVILRGSSVADKHQYEIYYHIIEWHVPPCSQNYWVPQNKSNKMWRWKDAWRVCFLLLFHFFFKCICTILMALPDKVHRLWLEQEAFHRTYLGGKYIFTCFYVVTDFFVCVCLFCYLSFHLGFLGCLWQRVFTSFYSFS